MQLSKALQGISKGMDAKVVFVVETTNKVEVRECQQEALQCFNSVDTRWKAPPPFTNVPEELTAGAGHETLELQCFCAMSEMELCGSCCDELAPSS